MLIDNRNLEQGIKGFQVSNGLLGELVPDTRGRICAEIFIFLGDDNFDELISNLFVAEIVVFFGSAQFLLDVSESNSAEFG